MKSGKKSSYYLYAGFYKDPHWEPWGEEEEGDQQECIGEFNTIELCKAYLLTGCKGIDWAFAVDTRSKKLIFLGVPKEERTRGEDSVLLEKVSKYFTKSTLNSSTTPFDTPLRQGKNQRDLV